MQNQIFINMIKEMEFIDIDWISCAFLHITRILCVHSNFA